MTASGYEIRPYSSELLPQVAELMQFLWGGVYETNVTYFQWKHVDNPYVDHPLAIVALKNGKLAGFRAYFATKWLAGSEGSEFILLLPGDTCVHPDHRRQGLSVSMGNRATQEFENKFKIYLNTSCSAGALPGYKKLGFHSLMSKAILTIDKKGKSYKDFIPRKIKNYLRKSGAMGTARIKFKTEKNGDPKGNKLDKILGGFGDILVSEKPNPEEMTRVISRQKTKSANIRLFQDEAFFRWRFQNNKKKYLFYFYQPFAEIQGYIVLGLNANYKQAMILDFAGVEGETLEELLDFIIRSKWYDRLSIYNFGMNENLRRALTGLGIQQQNWEKEIKTHEKEAIPLLVRPVKAHPSEQDWLIHSIDIRQMENWDIKPISCDGE
jgi:GNAT superfamily N-acetyltransferase